VRLHRVGLEKGGMTSTAQGQAKREALVPVGQPVLVVTEVKSTVSDAQSDPDDSDSEYSDPGSSDDSEEASENMLDVDVRNITQPAKVARYAEQIVVNAQQELPAHAISSQDIISMQGRPMDESFPFAVTWIFRVQAFCGMTTDAVYAAAGFLVATLATRLVPPEELELTAVTCVWMASKIEEGRVLQLTRLVELCLNKYDSHAFVACERKLLVDINFHLTCPTAKLFLRRFLEAIHAEDEIVYAANFFCELGLFRIEFLDFGLDVNALASVCLAKLTLGAFCPTQRLMAYAHFTDLGRTKECAGRLLEYAAQVKEEQSHIVFQRYSNGDNREIFTHITLSPEVLAGF
jgi:hypothetical protein